MRTQQDIYDFFFLTFNFLRISDLNAAAWHSRDHQKQTSEHASPHLGLAPRNHHFKLHGLSGINLNISR